MIRCVGGVWGRSCFSCDEISGLLVCQLQRFAFFFHQFGAAAGINRNKPATGNVPGRIAERETDGFLDVFLAVDGDVFDEERRFAGTDDIAFSDVDFPDIFRRDVQFQT